MKITLLLALVMAAACSQQSSSTAQFSATAAATTPSKPTFASTPPSGVPPLVKLQVTYRPQDADNWCWAAVSQMVMEFIKVNAEQCKQADKRLGFTTCCPTPTKDYCDRASRLSFDLYSLTAKSGATMSEYDIIRELTVTKQPFVFRRTYDEGPPHFFVVYGYEYDAAGFNLWIYDPWKGSGNKSGLITFDSFLDGADYDLAEVLYDVH